MKLYKIDESGEILRISWIMDEGESLKQAHVDISQHASAQKVELVSNVLESDPIFPIPAISRNRPA